MIYWVTILVVCVSILAVMAWMLGDYIDTECEIEARFQCDAEDMFLFW